MLEIKDIEHLAKLARIQLSDAEKQKFLAEIDPILGYVKQVNDVVATVGEEKKAGTHRNVTRADALSQSAAETAAIVENFPAKEGNYLKVKKIL